jgi:pilus assembly protein CpaF
MGASLGAEVGRVHALISVRSPEGAMEEVRIDQWPASVGKARGCAITLSGWRAGKEHARLYLQGQEIWLEDLGSMAGTWIDGKRVVRHGPLHPSDEIELAGYRLRLVDGIAHAPRDAGLTSVAASRSDRQVPAAPNGQVVKPQASAKPAQGDALATKSTRATPMFQWRQKVHALLLDTIDLRRRDLVRMTDEELRRETDGLIAEIIKRHEAEIPDDIDRDVLRSVVLHEAVGLGPLEDLLADAAITEIMVNRFDEVFVERAGRLQRHDTCFSSDRAVLGIIERVVSPLGRRIDESSPMVDARLKDGSRVNAIIPPLAIKGPTITIRKFATRKLQPEDLVGYGSISEPMMGFLETCVKQRRNIIVSGGTGSGKTTFLNVLSNFIPDGERIVTVEDAAELKLAHSHLVSLEARPSNAEGRGAVAIRDLVKNCLRMRPDRIVVGECRAGEALDMLQAMNTGHEGSLTTLHANTPRDAVARLETLVLMAGMDLPLAAIREQIASAIDVIVQQSRFPCGARRITSITEVCGMENGRIQLLELFHFERSGRDAEGRTVGKFKSRGVVPTFFDELREQGAAIDVSAFAVEEGA